MDNASAPLEVECPNCIELPRHDAIDEKCMLWELLSVRAGDEGWTVEELRARMKRVNVDAFWDQLGPVLDQLVDGDFDYTPEELRRMEV